MKKDPMHPRSGVGGQPQALRWPRLPLAIRLTLVASAACGILVLAAAEAEFRRDLPDAVRRAASLGNSRYDERLAELDPEHARDILHEAVRADPRAASVWISLGLLEERSTEDSVRAGSSPAPGSLVQSPLLPGSLVRSYAHKTFFGDRSGERIAERGSFGDFGAAREAFETAFRVDRQYAPAWALANFCFRRGDQECFWRAASRAFARHPAWAVAASERFSTTTDLGPLLDLASRMEPSPTGAIDRLVAGVAGENPPDRDAAFVNPTGTTTLEKALGNLSKIRWAIPYATPYAVPSAAPYATPYAAPYATPATAAAPLERAYLSFLIGKSQWDDAVSVARLISAELTRSERARRGAPGATPHQASDADLLDADLPDAALNNAADMARLDDFVTRLIAVGRVPAAVGLWNEFAGFAALDPGRGLSLTNGDFGREPRNAGFDWRLGLAPRSPASRRTDSTRAPPASDGIEPLWTPSQLEFRFTGEEPEQRLLAEQWLPVRARRYRLTFEYETRALPSPTGIGWEFAAKEHSPEPTPEVPSLAPAAGWQTAHWSFEGAEGVAPLRLVYRRAPGTVHARGAFLIRRVRLEAL